jgi:hypothetical protein
MAKKPIRSSKKGYIDKPTFPEFKMIKSPEKFIKDLKYKSLRLV